MVYSIGWLSALRDETPDDVIGRAIERLTAQELGARSVHRSAGDRWASARFELPDGGSPSLEVHQFDTVVDLMIAAAEEAGVDVSFLPDSFVEWYPHTSEAGLMDVVRGAVIAGAAHVLWDSVDGYGIGLKNDRAHPDGSSTSTTNSGSECDSKGGVH
ncbi:hypothetical protein L1785_02665 [Antribacter sp. KLBMP9083]|uniref:Uncharacterized protein n=1 Tax=Antribacter soli TaxID=2910976 RepID=A0AA41QB31_9MICO|nr:hypothetical protein [Antribacter soli]MCF4119872.1 hypothetical protein [Antribacter soli]